MAVNDGDFIYLDLSNDEVAPVVPEDVTKKMNDFLKRVRPDQYDDVFKVLQSHAVSGTDANRSP